MDLSQLSCRKLWQLTWPVMVSLLIQQLIGMTDAAFLGRVGEIELGAAALGSVCYLGLYILGFGFSLGAQIIIGRRNGEGNFQAIGPLFFCGRRFSLLLAGLLALAGYVLLPAILRPTIHSPAVLEAVITYLFWRLPGLFMTFPGVMYRAFFVGVADTRILTWSGVATLLTNLALNDLLIFGKFGFPELGIAGAALASVLAEGAGLFALILYTRLRVDRQRYALDRRNRFQRQWPLLREILNTSFWTMLQLFLAVAVWFSFFLAVEHLGERQLAAVNILRNLANFPFMIFSAFATVGGSLVSNLIGAGKGDQLFALLRRLLKLALPGTSCFLLLLVCFPDLILRIFTDRPELIATTRDAMYALVINALIQTVAYVLFNAVSGTGNTRVALGLELAASAAYSVVVYFVVIRARAEVGLCWLCDGLYAVVLGSLSWCYLRSGRWRNRQV